ncbi:hypothetical protein ACJX0J_039399, partial [Zea mays]
KEAFNNSMFKQIVTNFTNSISNEVAAAADDVLGLQKYMQEFIIILYIAHTLVIWRSSDIIQQNEVLAVAIPRAKLIHDLPTAFQKLIDEDLHELIHYYLNSIVELMSTLEKSQHLFVAKFIPLSKIPSSQLYCILFLLKNMHVTCFFRSNIYMDDSSCKLLVKVDPKIHYSKFPPAHVAQDMGYQYIHIKIMT